MDDLPVFRANKRRKPTRLRSELSPADVETTQELPPGDDDLEQAENTVNVAELLKWRRQGKHKSVGVRFAPQQQRSDDIAEDSVALPLTTVDSDEERLKDIANRFVGSTGQIVDVDKHMMAYVDSEMAKRHQSGVARHEAQYEQQQRSPAELSYKDDGAEPETRISRVKTIPEYRPRNQLSEFDLGPDAQQINLARTEAAIARATSGLPLQPQPPEERKARKPPRKPRLGRDGRPLRPRPRKRRNSEDVARDALVEQVLHEHKVDVYESGDKAESAVANANMDDDNDDKAADDRLAEQFKQQFMDAAAERRMKRQNKSSSSAAKAKAKGTGSDHPSGPKLGGSRSARAKMAQWQQQQKAASGTK